MNLNGIWKIEIFGPYGWEPMSTAFLEDGTYKSGSMNHYAVGSYQILDNRVKVSANYVTHGEARALFGKKQNQMGLEFEGDINEDQIQGQASEGEGIYKVTFRASRLADLP